MSATQTLFVVSPNPPPLAWRVVHLDGHSFIYTDAGTLVCVVPRQVGMVPISAGFIISACQHHQELVRLVKVAAYLLGDGVDEGTTPGLEFSPALAREFCAQAAALLHMAQPRTGS